MNEASQFVPDRRVATGQVSVSATDTQAPTVPDSVVATNGASDPVLAHVSWTASTDDVAVDGYHVWRATESTGTFSIIGTTTALSFDDTSDYRLAGYVYAISALDAAGNESAFSTPSALAGPLWEKIPHGNFTPLTNNCRICHGVHLRSQNLLRGETPSQSAIDVCYQCHDGSVASNVKAGPSNSFALSSGHVLEDVASNPDKTNTCGDCHQPHVDKKYVPGLPQSTINGATVSGRDSSWCESCHNDTNDWYSGAYPAASNPVRLVNGYPSLGTYPGRTVYEDASKNVHSLIPSSTPNAQGSCLWCHSSHRSPNPYDGLTLTFRPTTAATLLTDQSSGAYAESCFQCHGGVAPSGLTTTPTNIKRFVLGSGATEGHRIRTAGGKLPVGAPLPCYDCHNPHGSKRSNRSLLTDELGRNLSTATSAETRSFCFSCHTSSDGKVWDSDAGAYVAVASTATVEGLKRNGADASALLLPDRGGHRWADTSSCSTCHGKDYADGGSNVHNPGGGGESVGQEACLGCHSYSGMQSASSFHHYMTSDAATTYPLVADASTLTTTDARRTCLSCHVDHDYFSAANTSTAHTGGRAQNLRSSVASSPAKTDGSTYIATDYDNSVAGGGSSVCLSCHKASMVKNTSGRSTASDEVTTTPAITSSNYYNSAHQYAVNATYSQLGVSSRFSSDNSAFSANCVKCHNDALTKQFQSNGSTLSKFGLHDSDKASSFVSTTSISADPQEQACWLCHSRATDTAPNNPKGGNAYGGSGTDFYGGGVMGSGGMFAEALDVKGEFTNPAIVSRHPVDGDGTTSARVECANCHNIHKTEFNTKFSSASGVAQDPDNTLIGDSAVNVKYYFESGVLGSGELSTNRDYCLKCHDGQAPAAKNTGSVYVPYSVYVPTSDETTSNPSKRPNKSRYIGRSHFNINASETSASALTIGLQCADCHDKHGSTLPALLGRSATATGARSINAVTVTGNDNSVCGACHSAATPNATAPSRNASGYPTEGTWPGQSVFAGSIHSGSNVKWPGREGDYAGGDCKNCHDVHGTANSFDELRTENAAGLEGQFAYTPGNVSFCFNCHDGSPAAANIKQYYPTTMGGSATQDATTRFGHKTETAGNLPAGSGLPCYDCHNPHGSKSASGLSVVTQFGATTVVVGDQAGEIGMSTASGVREYCLACHSTYDTAAGYNGSTYVAVGAGKVEGLRRDGADGSVLKLPSNPGHLQSSGISCYTCHGDDAVNNVHNPSPGAASSGGQSCYGCHGEYQASMEDDSGSSTGSSNAGSYHHVLGGAAGDGDIAPGAGMYQTSTTDVYCTSCHVDHNYFNGKAGSNLRSNIASGSVVTTNTDYLTSGGYGICASCHSVSQAKQGMGTEQASGGSSRTPVISGTDFATSAHNYTVASSFSGSTFNANCSKCHSDEQSKSYQTSTNAFGTHWSDSVGILRALGVFAANPAKDEACFQCHNSTAAVYGESLSAAAKATQSEFTRTSSHDLSKVTCENCHNVHKASTSSPVANPDNIYSAASVATTASVNSFCLSCHDGAAPSATVNDSVLVPYAVTVAAKDNVSAFYSTDGHGLYVDCRDCHEQHGSTLRQLLKTTVDGQSVSTYTDTNDETYCLSCHRAGGAAASSDIARYYPTTAGGTAVQSSSPTWTRFGHRIESAGGSVAQGGSMPCRQCHNPHGGSGSGYMIVVRTQVAAGVDTLIGDSAGEITMSDSSQTPANVANVRRFCFTCHTTSDTSFGWNGNSMALVPSGAQVVGLSRTAGVLKLPDLGTIKGHKQAETDSCYLCHGDDFSQSDSVNVHNPGGGESRGGIECYTCHTVYENRMEDGLGTATGSSRTSSYHHVLGSAGKDGDTTSSPTLSADGRENVYCLSCHVDHDKFSPLVSGTQKRSANLRSAFSDAAVTATNTDFVAAGGGVCLGCHSIEVNRDNTGQKAEANSSKTTEITPTVYDASPHQYSVTSTFTDGAIFNADCSKCHDSEIDGGGMESGKATSGFQTSTYRFSTHYSSARRILGSLGVTITDPPAEEDVCYSCHSNASDGRKSTVGKDWYGTASMSATSQAIYGLMNTTKSNVLYFTPSAQAAASEPMPNTHQTGDTFTGGTWAGRLMSPLPASTSYETKTTTITALTAGARWQMVSFSSPPVSSATSLAAGTWTINLWAQESNANANALVRYMIYKWNANDTLGTTVVATGNTAEIGTTAAPGSLHTFGLAGGAVTLAAGDKLGICLEIQTSATTATNYTANFYYGSGAGSNLTLPSTVTFASPGFGHSMNSRSGLHRPSNTDETQAYLSANKHVECGDCHNVHAAGKTAHTRGGATGNAIGADSPIQDVSGVSLTAGTTNWSLTGATVTSTADATYEYQICFKCHSRANTALATWSPAAPHEWTDVALEFSPANKAGHPVVATLNNSSGRGAPKALTAAQMSAPWTNVGNQTMMCSDCHGDSAATPAAQGPHGSAVEHMLKGPNTYWPANASGALYVLGNPPTLTGLFCTNCHPVYSGGYKNGAHSDKASRYGNVACIRCHILVPHGGKVSRLIGTNTAGLPTRYAYQATRSNLWVNAFGKTTPNGYTKEYCYSTNGACNAHAASGFANESW